MQLLRNVAFVIAFAATVNACSSLSNPTTPTTAAAIHRKATANSTEYLVAYDNAADDIEEWVVTSTGGTKPSVLATLTGNFASTNVVAMSADGDILDIASTSPAQTVQYDLSTGTAVLQPDTGTAVDVADVCCQTSSTVYSSGIRKTMPYDRSPGRTIACGTIASGVAVASDSKSNVYVQGAGSDGYVGVFEYGFSTHACTELPLKVQKGTAAGIGMDSSDDLIVADNPNSCAGSNDGRIIVYTPPYSASSGTARNISANVGCAGLFRLDSGTTGITYLFMLDSNGGSPRIDQFRYSNTSFRGSYSGGNPSAPTTLPNTVPN
ncbi:MAG: hypothetical protein WB615_08465 [Candidatus Tumulicola sp.]